MVKKVWRYVHSYRHNNTTLDRRTDGRIYILYQIRASLYWPAIKTALLHRVWVAFCKKLPLCVWELILTVPCIVANKVHLCLSFPHSNQIVFTERQCCPTWSKVWRGYVVVDFQVGCSPETAEFNCYNQRSIPYSFICDRDNGCEDLSDEVNCDTSSTDVMLFTIAVYICGYWLLLRIYSMTSICAWETQCSNYMPARVCRAPSLLVRAPILSEIFGVQRGPA